MNSKFELDNSAIKTIFDELKESKLNNQQKKYVTLLEDKFEGLTAHSKLPKSDLYDKLTPAEIKISELIRMGNTSGEIADLLKLSTRTVEVHRNNIRNKLGIRNKKVNLRIYLMTN